MNIVGNKGKCVRNDAVNSQPFRKSCHEHRFGRNCPGTARSAGKVAPVLAQKLIESLEEEDSPDAVKQWIEIAKRRAKEMDDGTEPGVPAEEVFRQREEELG